MPEPILLGPDDLWTDVDLALAHWSLDLMLRGGRTILEAREVERRSTPMVRSSFEHAADRRVG